MKEKEKEKEQKQKQKESKKSLKWAPGILKEGKKEKRKKGKGKREKGKGKREKGKGKRETSEVMKKIQIWVSIGSAGRAILPLAVTMAESFIWIYCPITMFREKRKKKRSATGCDQEDDAGKNEIHSESFYDSPCESENNRVIKV